MVEGIDKIPRETFSAIMTRVEFSKVANSGKERPHLTHSTVPVICTLVRLPCSIIHASGQKEQHTTTSSSDISPPRLPQTQKGHHASETWTCRHPGRADRPLQRQTRGDVQDLRSPYSAAWCVDESTRLMSRKNLGCFSWRFFGFFFSHFFLSNTSGPFADYLP